MVGGAEMGIHIVPPLPTGLVATIVFVANLPAAGIAAEEGNVPTVGDELFEVVSHRGGIVLVMAEAEDSRSVKDFRGNSRSLLTA